MILWYSNKQIDLIYNYTRLLVMDWVSKVTGFRQPDSFKFSAISEDRFRARKPSIHICLHSTGLLYIWGVDEICCQLKPGLSALNHSFKILLHLDNLSKTVSIRDPQTPELLNSQWIERSYNVRGSKTLDTCDVNTNISREFEELYPRLLRTSKLGYIMMMSHPPLKHCPFPF